MIVCLHLPFFVAGVERRDTDVPTARPLLVVAPERVYAVCPLALEAGVRPGISLANAQSRCSDAYLYPARPLHYQQVEEAITECLARFSSLIEVRREVVGHTFFVELPLLNESETRDAARQMGQAVRKEVQLAPAIGIASGKFPAQVAAASIQRNRTRVVGAGTEVEMLHLQPVETLPLPEEMVRRLPMLGIRTVGQFAALPIGAVYRQWGRTGRHLHRLAQGGDERPIRARLARPTTEATHRFDDPIAERVVLQRVLAQLAGQLGWELRRQRHAARALWIRVELEDGTTRERRRTWQEPLLESKPLEQALQGLLEQVWVHCGVVALTVLATDLVPLGTGARQLDLFAQPTALETRFREMLPYLRNRYGTDRFLCVSLADESAALPEQGFRLQSISDG